MRWIEHRKGPRPVSYKINLRFRRFSSRTGHLTGLVVYYIAPRPKRCSARVVDLRAQYLAQIRPNWTRPAAISPCTITMDHDAIICSIDD